LPLVATGLDPVAHAEFSRLNWERRRLGMDGRVKPGHDAGSSPLEELHGALVLLRLSAAPKGAEIAAPAGLRIYFTRIEPVLAGCELANYGQQAPDGWRRCVGQNPTRESVPVKPRA